MYLYTYTHGGEIKISPFLLIKRETSRVAPKFTVGKSRGEVLLTRDLQVRVLRGTMFIFVHTDHCIFWNHQRLMLNLLCCHPPFVNETFPVVSCSRIPVLQRLRNAHTFLPCSPVTANTWYCSGSSLFQVLWIKQISEMYWKRKDWSLFTLMNTRHGLVGTCNIPK